MNKSNQTQSSNELADINKQLKIEIMLKKATKYNLVNSSNQTQNEIIEMKEELDELNKTIEEIEIQMDELEYKSDEYGELQNEFFYNNILRDIIENQLTTIKLQKKWSKIDREITDIESYIDDYNSGYLEVIQGDTKSDYFIIDLEEKEEVILPELQEKSDKIWKQIQELREQFESLITRRNLIILN